ACRQPHPLIREVGHARPLTLTKSLLARRHCRAQHPDMRNLVRLFRSALAPLLAAALLVLSLPTFAGDAKADAALDTLFAQLRIAPNAETAQKIDQEIWAVWTTPSDPELARRMREVLVARGTGNLAAALRLLDGMVADFPDYAEGWNQRAT